MLSLSFWLCFIIIIGLSEARIARHHDRRGNKKINIYHKYLLVTTQRSGSEWLCISLDAIDRIACGVEDKNATSHKRSEMMIQYSFVKSIESWDNWVRDADQAFATVAEEQRGGGMIGFKIMYDQIKRENAKKFTSYVKERNITVIHLVREAQINRLTSAHFLAQHEPHHSLKASDVILNDSVNISKNSAIKYLEHQESLNSWWSTRLRLSAHVMYIYVVYEIILDAAMLHRFFHIFFAGVSNGQMQWNGVQHHENDLLMLHDSKCEHRVSNWKELTKALSDSVTELACEAIDELA